MNLALFASSFYPNLGGVEELVRQLAREYRRRGHEAIVITNQWPPSLPKRSMCEGIPVYRIPMRVPDGPARARLKFRATHGGILREAGAIMRRHQVDLVHVQCVSTNGYYARKLAVKLQLPLVVTSQGERTMDKEDAFARSKILNSIMRDLLTHAEFVTACSRWTLDDLERYMGRSFDDRARAIHNGVSLEEFDNPAILPYSHPSPFVLALGRWVPQKGFDVLLRAFAEAVRDDDTFSHDLLLAGEGGEAPELERIVAELGLRRRVHLLGRADRPLTVSLFKGASWFVLPSVADEGFPLVIPEAMAGGNPVIATPVGGVPEMVRNNENGLLVAPRDTRALAEAMKKLAFEDGVADRLAQAAQATARRFAWPRIADEYEAVYDAVLTESRKVSGLA
jgi:glycosyltransferase involved in cell wall biosynthesis